ncbi:MAG: hypothetical protein JNM32_06115 [Dechloromonas sp.]|nr:hypothetical protein [Dechloromonas sp.]
MHNTLHRSLLLSLALHLLAIVGGDFLIRKVAFEAPVAHLHRISARLESPPQPPPPEQSPAISSVEPKSDSVPIHTQSEESGRSHTTPASPPSPAAEVENNLDFRPPEIIANSPSDIQFPEGLVVHGEFRLEITIDREGRPLAVRTLHSTLPAPIERLVTAQFLRARYRPAMRNGLPVTASMEVSIAVSPSE